MKLGKRLVSLALALVMVFGLTVNVSAATTRNIKVQLSSNITVKYNGEIQSMTDVNGTPVYPLLNGGTTYLPVRAVSNMLGVDVDWDGATQTVILTDPAGGRKPVPSTGSTSAKPAPSTVTVQLSPGITVKYNGKVQSMTDVNGTPVYPLLNGGTTYLPIRAVSNMLGLNVDWDGATQTVLLDSENNAAVVISPDKETVDNFLNSLGTPGITSSSPHTITISKPTVERIRKVMEMFEYPDYAIEAAIAEFEAKDHNDGNGAFIYEAFLNKKDTFKTGEAVQVIGNKHAANDYIEVDLSTAGDGYVRVKLTEQVSDYVSCSIDGANVPNSPDGLRAFQLEPGRWVPIQLPGESDYYQLNVSLMFYPSFNVAFIATVENPDGWWCVSSPKVDFENAPKTVAKAAELTKNCKTDAEKITAIFNYVANNISYDNQESARRIAVVIEKNAGTYVNESEPSSSDLEPDNILTSRKGVCQHYAILMAAMLRSLGIPCKVVSGDVYTGERIKGYNDDNPGWMGHAWVSVSPDTKGLDMTRLGAGHDEDGWIRLDPTWGNNPTSRAKAAIDKNHKSDYAY